METAVVDPSHRPLGIATDDANQNFAGARDPDSALFVQFYQKPVQNFYRTKEEGRPIFEDRLFIRIEIPGNRNSIIDTLASDTHKIRFQRQYQFFASKNPEGQLSGTPLSAWNFLAASKVEELRFLGFRTVEQVAAASDGNISKIGMAAGIDPYQFRERAKRYLQASQDDASLQKTADEADKLKAELQAEREARKAQEEKHAKEMEELRALISQATQKRKPGRPKKVIEAT